MSARESVINYLCLALNGYKILFRNLFHSFLTKSQGKYPMPVGGIYIIMLDLSRPNMQPINNIEKNIVYSGSKENVMMTMIEGIIRYENGKFNIGVEPSQLYSKAEEIKKRIYG